MNLREIARIAVDEALEEELPDGITRTDNGDGTVTYSMTIGFDPEVQAEMSKAMPKGQKREDLVDLEVEKVGGGGQRTEYSCDSFAEDQAPKGVFALALDEAIAEDAGGSRHANTPLENCRAKDPMFCPYHGQKAIQKWVEDEIASVTTQKIASLYDVDVIPTSNNRQFEVKITGPSGSNSAIFTGILTSLASKNGIKMLQPITSDLGGSGKPQEHQIEIDAKPDYDKEGLLKEWTDDLMIDVANDPQLQQEIDPKEFADYLGKLEVVQSAANNAKNAAAMGIPQQTADQAYKSALDDAEKAYHMLRGQVEFKGRTVSILSNFVTNTCTSNRIDKGDYHKEKADVDITKAIFWAKGKFPNGFAKSNPFVKKYNDASQAVGYFAEKKFDDALAEYTVWNVHVQSAGSPPTASDIQQLKGITSSIKYGAENYAEALKRYKAAKQTFMQELYDWAVQNQGQANCPNMQAVNQAFPNGRPQ